MDKVATCKIVQEDSTCRDLLHEALQYHLLVDRRSEMSINNSRMKPRTCSGRKKIFRCVAKIEKTNIDFVGIEKQKELSETLVFLGGEDERVVVRGVEVYNPER